MSDSVLPRHIAIIMDGNGRWALQRRLPRMAGHRAGLHSAREVVRCCLEKGIHTVTLFTFSSENWLRPKQEVAGLMKLMLMTLENELDSLDKSGIRLRFIGHWQQFNSGLRDKIIAAEAKTKNNKAMQLVIAANYGGRWDITQAAQQIVRDVQANKIALEDIDENLFGQYISVAQLPEPDLFIRTSGEFRISNFLLWSLAYTELYFPEVLWPDFKQAHFEEALAAYAKRCRRFGKTHA